MSWLQLEFAVPADEVDALEALLLEAGALAISLVSEADEQILEPRPGETPLWSVIRLSALMPLDLDLKTLRPQLPVGRAFEIKFVGDSDWQQQARQYAANRVFAGRLHLCPPDAPVAADAPDVSRLLLEPGLAFGSGTHPTTELCLQWLAESIPDMPNVRVLDFGCGSGILAIGACLLGARACAVDYDQQAVVATQENARRNGVSETGLSETGESEIGVAETDGAALQVLHTDAWSQLAPRPVFEVVVANILAQPLKQLAPEMQAHMGEGACIVLSGLLVEQAAEVMAAYTQIEFDEPRQSQGWVCLVGRKRLN